MERNSNKIIYLKSGQTLHFFHSPTEGLCMRDGSGTKVLLEEAYHDFDVCSLGGEIYLACQNTDGDLIFLKYFDAQWHKYSLLISKNKCAYDKHFCLVPTGSCVQLFYTVKSGEKLLLAQQILGEGTNPVAVAQICDGQNPFSILADSELNSYIYYQNEQGQFGYKIYKWSAKTTGEFSPIADMPVTSIYAVADAYSNHHLCAVSGDQIIYIKRAASGNFGSAKDISRIEIPYENMPYVYICGEKIYVVWCFGKLVMYSKSTDGGETFSSPVRLMSSGDMPTLFSIQKNNSRTMSPGYFSDGEIRFFSIGDAGAGNAVLQNQSNGFVRRTPSPDKDAELSRLKNAVAALGGEVSEMKNRLEMLESFLKDKA